MVSVLMTAYNREKYIHEAIDSVLASTFQNWELIIVDDCSTDSTIEVALAYQKRDSRIRIFTNEKNLGDYPNRNRAASYARGYYLKYIDADDKIYPHGLEIMVSNMEKFPDAGWGIASLRQDDDQIFPFKLTPTESYTRNYLFFKKRGSNNNKIFSKAPLSVIIKREVFECENGFKPVRHFGDGDMWNRLGRKYPVVLMQDGIVWWRKHDQQENRKRSNNYVTRIKSANNIIEHLSHPACPLSEIQTRALIKEIRYSQFKLILNQFIKTGSLATARSMFKQMRLLSTE